MLWFEITDLTSANCPILVRTYCTAVLMHKLGRLDMTDIVFMVVVWPNSMQGSIS